MDPFSKSVAQRSKNPKIPKISTQQHLRWQVFCDCNRKNGKKSFSIYVYIDTVMCICIYKWIGLKLENVQGKGTGSFGKRMNKSHTLCVRCGRRSFHLQKSRCASCGYPSSRIRTCINPFSLPYYYYFYFFISFI